MNKFHITLSYDDQHYQLRLAHVCRMYELIRETEHSQVFTAPCRRVGAPIYFAFIVESKQRAGVQRRLNTFSW